MDFLVLIILNERLLVSDNRLARELLATCAADFSAQDVSTAARGFGVFAHRGANSMEALVEMALQMELEVGGLLANFFFLGRLK